MRRGFTLPELMIAILVGLVVIKHADAPAPPLISVAPGAPPLVARLVDRALSKDPADRPGSALEFHAELEAALRGERSGRWRRSRRLAPVLAAAVVAFALVRAGVPGRRAPVDDGALRGSAAAILSRLAVSPAAGEVVRAVEGAAGAGAPAEQLLVAAGEELDARGRIAQALACFRRATEVGPSNVRAWSLLGRYLRETGEPVGAESALRIACRLDPRDPAAGIELALTLSRAERWKEAAAELRRVLEVDPQNATARRHLVAIANRSF